MESFAVGLLILVTLFTFFVTVVDLWRCANLSRQAKLNLFFLISFLPLIGSALYYTFFKPTLTRSFPRGK